jgi:hypothetical protein
LSTHLHALRFPDAFQDVGNPAALVVNGDEGVSFRGGLEDVDDGDESEIRRRQVDGAQPEIVGSRCVVVEGGVTRACDAAVLVGAVECVGGMLELAVDPLEVGEPRAVGELVENPGRGEFRKIPAWLRSIGRRSDRIRGSGHGESVRAGGGGRRPVRSEIGWGYHDFRQRSQKNSCALSANIE